MKYPGHLAIVEALCNMQTTKSMSLSAASLLESISWSARTVMEMVGMVDLLRSEDMTIAGIFQQDTVKANMFIIQVVIGGRWWWL